MRLFIAVHLEEEVKDQIEALINRLSHYATQGRFVSKENLHLTLEFLGEIEEERVAVLKEMLNDLAYTSFPLKMTELGHFTSRKGNIYWLGLEPSEELYALQRLLHRQLLEKQFEVEDRAFLPHITIARKLKFKGNFNQKAITDQIEHIETKVERIVLMESKNVARKLVYSTIHSTDLH